MEIPFCTDKNCYVKDRTCNDKHRHIEDGIIQFIWISPEMRPEIEKINIESFDVHFSDDK